MPTSNLASIWKSPATEPGWAFFSMIQFQSLANYRNQPRLFWTIKNETLHLNWNLLKSPQSKPISIRAIYISELTTSMDYRFDLKDEGVLPEVRLQAFDGSSQGRISVQKMGPEKRWQVWDVLLDVNGYRALEHPIEMMSKSFWKNRLRYKRCFVRYQWVMKMSV